MCEDLPTHTIVPTVQPSQTYQHTPLYLLYSPHRPTNTHYCTYCTDLPTHTTVPTVQTYQHTPLYLLHTPLGTYSASDITLSSSSGRASSSISPRTAADETLNDSGISSADCMRLSQPETDRQTRSVKPCYVFCVTKHVQKARFNLNELQL